MRCSTVHQTGAVRVTRESRRSHLIRLDLLPACTAFGARKYHKTLGVHSPEAGEQRHICRGEPRPRAIHGLIARHAQRYRGVGCGSRGAGGQGLASRVVRGDRSVSIPDRSEVGAARVVKVVDLPIQEPTRLLEYNRAAACSLRYATSRV